MRAWNCIAVNQKIQPIGLDIGHNSLKMVQLAVSEDHIKVLAARRVPLNADPAVDGEDRERAVVEALRHLLADSQVRGLAGHFRASH